VNDADGTIKGSPQVAINCVMLCNGNTNLSVPAGDCSGYANTQRVIINNLGQIQFSGYWSGGGQWVDVADCICGTAIPYTIPSPKVCSNGICDFYYANGDAGYGSGQGCNRLNSSNAWTSQIYIDLASGCNTPKLRINSPIGGTITSGGYNFNFSILDTLGWSGIQCSFNLNGVVDVYSSYFTDLEIQFNVPFTVYSRQFTLASISCSYLNVINQSTPFGGQSWLVDSSNNIYKIADANRMIGNLTYDPYALYSWGNLSSISFRLVNLADKSDYLKKVKHYLTTNTNLTELGCAGTLNSTGILQPPLYSIDYTSAHLYCNQSASIPFNLSVYDQNTNTYIDGGEFNLTWSTGSMAIDNINLIKNANNGNNTELWARVSTDYARRPISDNADLSCNYSLVADNSSSYSGPMDIVYGFTPDYTEIWTTDIHNSSIISNAYNIGNGFAVQINCSANGYYPKIQNVYRWLGRKRLTDFVCYPEGMEVGFENPYYTKQIQVSCIVKPDTTYNYSDADDKNAVQSIYNYFGTNSYLTLSKNINPSGCVDNMPPTSKDNLGGISSGWVSLAVRFDGVSFKDKNTVCSLVQLSAGKVSVDLVDFSSDIYGNIFDSAITPTSATLTFDLKYLAQLEIYGTALRILNNKTTNIGIVESGDTLGCFTEYKDPSGQIAKIVQTVKNDEGNTCAIASSNYISNLNDTWDYISFIPVNKDTCPFFDIPNSNGVIYCTADVYTPKTSEMHGVPSDYEIKTYTSNAIPYSTPNPTAVQNATGAITHKLGTWLDDTIRGIEDLIFANMVWVIIFLVGVIFTEPIWIRLVHIIWPQR
jgi:hypothetical protein